MRDIKIAALGAMLTCACAGEFDPVLADTTQTGGETTDETGTTGDEDDATGSDDSSTDGGTTDGGDTTGEETDGTGGETTDDGGSTDTGEDLPGLGEECHFLHLQCEGDLTCTIYGDPDPDNQIFEWGCSAYVGEGPGDFGEPCDDDFMCANGFKCAAEQFLDEPVPYCDTTDGNVGCCTPYCESDDDCPGQLSCYYMAFVWDDLSPLVQQYGWPRICVDDTWMQKTPP